MYLPNVEAIRKHGRQGGGGGGGRTEGGIYTYVRIMFMYLCKCGSLWEAGRDELMYIQVYTCTCTCMCCIIHPKSP